MLHRILTVFCLVVLLQGASFLTMAAKSTPPNFVLKQVANAQVVGTEMFTYFLWDVYEATLYAPQGKWQPDQAFALALHYQRSLEGKKIAKRSVDEIRKQGMKDEKTLNAWLVKMEALFPDVKAGDVLTGIATPNKSSAFYFNDELVGIIEDSEFTAQFFAIWLSEKTSEPEFRSALLNQNRT